MKQHSELRSNTELRYFHLRSIFPYPQFYDVTNIPLKRNRKVNTLTSIWRSQGEHSHVNLTVARWALSRQSDVHPGYTLPTPPCSSMIGSQTALTCLSVHRFSTCGKMTSYRSCHCYVNRHIVSSFQLPITANTSSDLGQGKRDTAMHQRVKWLHAAETGYISWLSILFCGNWYTKQDRHIQLFLWVKSRLMHSADIMQVHVKCIEIQHALVPSVRSQIEYNVLL